MQVTVSCPLCKVTTSEKEIVDNLFLMASEEPDMDDEIPDTQMCSVSWNDHSAEFQEIFYHEKLFRESN